MDPADSHPYKVAIVATRTTGDGFIVIYRQARSPQLLGHRGNAADYSALFEPRQTASWLPSCCRACRNPPSLVDESRSSGKPASFLVHPKSVGSMANGERRCRSAIPLGVFG